MKLKNIYVFVKDIERAIKFYTDVLGFSLHRKQDRYSILKFDDAWFGLLNESFIKDVARGNNCIPVFEVSDLKKEFERLKQLNIKFATELQELSDVVFFQFYDTEGNILEMYEEKKKDE